MQAPCRILVLLPVYKQNYILSPAYQSILNNFRAVKARSELDLAISIYDNSPLASENKVVVEGLPIFYYHDSDNPGVSKAYNYGYQQAKKLDFDWVLLMDQDTTLTGFGLMEYIKSIKMYPEILIHAPILKSGQLIISPSKYKFRRGFALKNIKPGIKRLGEIVPLNSGMCIKLSVFESVNGYNEKICLDFSDFDFIRRVSKKIKHFVVMPLVNNHALSSIDETYESSKIRYIYYCNGAYHSRISRIDPFIFGWVIFLRGLKLSLKFKSFAFFHIFLTTTLWRKGKSEV
ncbi:MAG: hypothetical protein H7Y07_08295 [Pyrinomonadaceae bacterium]|nr:hypothetical protein [Sphingobacteriaceae bacterium]